MNLKDLAKNPAPVRRKRETAVGAGVLGREPAEANSEENKSISEEIVKNPAPTGGSPVGAGLLTRGLEGQPSSEGRER